MKPLATFEHPESIPAAAGGTDCSAFPMLTAKGGVPFSLIGCSRPGNGAAAFGGLAGGTSTYPGYVSAHLAMPLQRNRRQATDNKLLKTGEMQ